jgi:hypothetical protein
MGIDFYNFDIWYLDLPNQLSGKFSNAARLKPVVKLGTPPLRNDWREGDGATMQTKVNS